MKVACLTFPLLFCVGPSFYVILSITCYYFYFVPDVVMLFLFMSSFIS